MTDEIEKPCEADEENKDEWYVPCCKVHKNDPYFLCEAKKKAFALGQVKMLEEVKKVKELLKDALYREPLNCQFLDMAFERLENLNHGLESDVKGASQNRPSPNFNDFVKELKEQVLMKKFNQPNWRVHFKDAVDELADKYRKRGKK